jgi:hypothetical protein
VRREYFIRIIQILLLVCILFFPFKNQAQCTTIDKDDYEIELFKFSSTYTLELRFLSTDINLNEYYIQLYNFDNALYYSDESGRRSVINDSGIILNKSGSILRFSGVPDGDFGIILEKNGCENQIIGYGYSGFPYSAIHVGI